MLQNYNFGRRKPQILQFFLPEYRRMETPYAPSPPSPEADFVYLFVWEKKNNSFEIAVIILRYIRNGNLLFKKDLKIAELYTKTSFFLYFRGRSKNDISIIKSVCARVTKHASKKVAKAETDLNWLWTTDCGLFWLYILHPWAIPIPMFSLVSWFLYFLQHLLQEHEVHET